MTLRKALFWLHLTAGCVCGAIILLMSVTGVLLTYERQMIAWGEWGGFRAPPPASGEPPMSLNALVEGVRLTEPGRPTSLTVRSGPEDPVAVRIGRDRTVYVNAYSGEVLGEGSGAWRAFFSSLRGWHRWLAMRGDDREVGKAITGASNLAFMFILISGIYMWWPRPWTRNRLASVTLFRRGLNGKARDFNWHNVIGFWSAALLFLIVLSGSVISYRLMSDAVYQAVGEAPPQRSRPASKKLVEKRTTAPETVDFEAVFATAREQFPDWESITIPLPESATKTLTVALDRGSGGQPHLKSSVIVEAATAKLVRREDFGDNTLGRRLRLLLRFIHTGEAGGLAGQTLAGIVTVGACVLVYTGIALSLRRLSAWLGRF